MFWLKKLISALLLPVPFGLFWITLGIILLSLDCAKRFRLSCFLIGLFVITLFSLNPISTALLDTLQSQYAPLMTIPNNVTQVVVLGCGDRKSTRLNSSHSQISYAVFCLKKEQTDFHCRHCSGIAYPHNAQQNVPH